jgi:predicted CXXCH cytochrome family protein
LRRPNRALVVAFGLSLVGAVAGLALTGATHLPGALAAETAPSPASPPAPTYVGSEACAGCHQPEAKLWNGSHHQLAMDHATEKSVLGDFAGATFEHYGVKSRFFRRDGKFFVETDGQDGRLAEFEVKYTFGVYPLQQYLIEFPDGRLQALSIAWDSRPKDKGGQRWFHLYPNEEVGHDDILHWTKLNQNWNFMCAECHSTGVRKNYDAAKNTFATTWAEISVGCETCHGQGSAHVAWAHNNPGWRETGKDDDAKGLIVRFDERKDAGWTIDPSTGNATRAAPPATLRKEVETCGLCHARRGTIAEDWVPGRWLSETHVVPPLSHGLYFADGQMEDEVYNYGSFKQSKMFAKGVTCSDCHDPHSAKVKLPGDGVCLQCHAADKYAVASHNRHEGVDPPVGCASCHMPTRTYMVVDPRHDHSLRIPRPDLSVKLGTPNACNACHADKTAQWADDAVQSWHGPERKGFQRYAEAFHDAWSGGADSQALLTAAASDREPPGFARAGALADLAPYLSQSTVDLAKSSLADPDPMVRIGALDMLGNAPAQEIWPLAAPLLSDPVRGVRIRAADLLAAVPSTRQPASDRGAFDRATQEFVAAQTLNADRPEARLTLGSFRARRGETAEAEAQYKAALALAPQFAPAAVNLADLYRQTGRDADGEQALRASLALSPKDAGLHYALGLALIRLKKPEAALGELRQAASLSPDNAQNVYVYAIALNSAGRSLEARKVLADVLAAHPDNRDILTALVQMSQQAGDLPSALLYAERLARLMPNDPDLARFVEELRRATAP